METLCSSVKSAGFPQATRRYIPENRTLHNHRNENLKSYTAFIIRLNCSCLRHYAGSRKFAGSSPDQLPNPSSCNMALGLTQPLTEMSTRTLPGDVKGGRRVCLTTLPPSVSRLSRQNVGASTSHTAMVLHGLLQGQLSPLLWIYK
jgi:hypothetical protein